ncbi:MAG: hypothetical protein IJN21_07575 [Clostridia bacterium]|nr:hypothetical protein [Clostridia bacterium]
MPNLNDKIGYIHGMMDGLKLNKEDDSVKLMYMMIDVIDSLAEAVSALESDQEELCDYVESIDDDLTELEMRFGDTYDDFDDDDHEIEFSAAPRKKGNLRILKDDEDEEEYEEETEDAEVEYFIGCVCPECGKFFSVKEPDSYPDDQKFICPFCKKTVSIEPMNPEKVPCAKPAPNPGDIPF